MKSLLFQWAIVLLLPVGLFAQNPKPKPATVKTPAPTASSSDLKFDAEDLKTLKSEMEKLRKTGKSNPEIALTLKGQKLPNNKTINKRELVKGLRKTTTRATVLPVAPPPPNTSPTAVAPPPVAPPPTAPPPSEELTDAAEIAVCLVSLNANGRLGMEDLSILVEEFQIPNLAGLLAILDLAGEFDDPAEIFPYAENMSDWIHHLRISPDESVRRSANNFTGFTAFFPICQSKGMTAMQTFQEFINNNLVFSWGSTFFAGMETSQSSNAVVGGISMVFNVPILGVAIHESRGSDGTASLGGFRNRFGRGQRNSMSINTWAAILKREDIPNGEGGFYPCFTSVEATTMLVDAGYSRQEVVDAVRAVYQN